MNSLSLYTFLGINIAIAFYYAISRKRSLFEFPFWMTVVNLGWFGPMAIGGLNYNFYSASAYSSGMIFASFCSAAVFFGFFRALGKPLKLDSFVCQTYDLDKVFAGAALLFIFGTFFYILYERTDTSMYVGEQGMTGLPTLYLFFRNTFKIALLVMVIFLLRKSEFRGKGKVLFFLVSGFLLLGYIAIFRGRRAEMMDMTCYLLFPLFFIRKLKIPKVLLFTLPLAGVLLAHGIGDYRSQMVGNNDLPIMERFEAVWEIDYWRNIEQIFENSGSEFRNYITFFSIYQDDWCFDFGIYHWNLFVFNYIPAQLIGRWIKDGLTFPIVNFVEVGFATRNYIWDAGSVVTGYLDAFGSFGWLGFIKFYLIGYMLGWAYRYAINGYWIGQFIYTFIFTSALHGFTHGTNEILVRVWVYLLMFGGGILYLSRKPASSFEVPIPPAPFSRD